MRARILGSLVALSFYSLSLLHAVPAAALTFVEVDYTCPITGEKFTAPTMASGTSFGSRLDFRKVGPIASPWPMVTCPSNGFPLFQEEFKTEQIETLKAFAATPEYKALVASHPVYYLVARLQRLLGYATEDIAFSLLYASWQAEANEQKALGYLEEALPLFQEVLEKQPPVDVRNVASLRFLTVELHRRLGRFEQAAALLEKYRAELEPVVPPDFMALETKLIQQRVSAPATPEMPKDKSP